MARGRGHHLSCTFLCNYNICEQRFIYETESRSRVFILVEVVGDATHVKNRNTRTRGNKKRFLLLRSLELILFHPPLKIIRVSFLLFFFLLSFVVETKEQVSIDERDSFSALLTETIRRLSREKLWIARNIEYQAASRLQPRLITPITV